jgi:hypothetical protein
MLTRIACAKDTPLRADLHRWRGVPTTLTVQLLNWMMAKLTGNPSTGTPRRPTPNGTERNHADTAITSSKWRRKERVEPLLSPNHCQKKPI